MKEIVIIAEDNRAIDSLYDILLNIKNNEDFYFDLYVKED